MVMIATRDTAVDTSIRTGDGVPATAAAAAAAAARCASTGQPELACNDQRGPHQRITALSIEASKQTLCKHARITKVCNDVNRTMVVQDVTVRGRKEARNVEQWS